MRRGVVLWAVGVVLAWPSPGAAATCDETREELRRELAIRPSGPEDPEAVERVKRIDVLFWQAAPGCAKELYEQLGEKDNGDELSSAFHYALATPSRAKLRATLRKVYEPYDKLDAAIEDGVSGAAEREHLQCWVELLRRGKATDTRAIPWKNVCPQDDQDCPQRELSDAKIATLHTKDDVENAGPPDLPIFQFLDATLDMTLISSDYAGAVRDMKELRRGIAETERHLADETLPAHYAAMKAWIADQEKDPTSILWCPQPLPAP